VSQWRKQLPGQISQTPVRLQSDLSDGISQQEKTTERGKTQTVPFGAHLRVVIAGTKGKTSWFFWKTMWAVSFSSHTLLVTYPFPGHGSPGWALIPEPRGADPALSYLGGKERAQFSGMARTCQPEPCSRPAGTRILSLVPSLPSRSRTWTNHFVSLCLYFPAVKWR